jgi:hypothetical protein
MGYLIQIKYMPTTAFVQNLPPWLRKTSIPPITEKYGRKTWSGHMVVPANRSSELFSDPYTTLIDPAGKPAFDGRPDTVSGEGNKKRNTERVGNESRGDEENAGNKDKYSIDQFVSGKAAHGYLLPDTHQRLDTLPFCQKSAGSSRNDHQNYRIEQTDCLADLQENEEFEKGDYRKKKQ